MERAYGNFFAKRADFPRFKKKGQSDSFRYPDPKQIKHDPANHRLFLPKLGWLRYRHSRDVLGTLKNVTVKHLRIQGFECAERQIESVADYRGIIQGIPSNSTDRQHQRYLRELVQEYSFTSSRQPLRQIEKIVSGMFRRKTNFDDLQSMVIDCVSDEIAAHSISGDRRKIEDWPRGYRAYTAVMGLAAKMVGNFRTIRAPETDRKRQL